MDDDAANDAQRFADEFRHVTLAHERLVLCVCGCSGDDARLVADALKKIVRIKLQMNNQFTRDAGSLSEALDRIVALSDSEERSDANSMDDLLRDAGRYFSSHEDDLQQQRSKSAVFRLVFLYRHDQKSPSMRFTQSEPSIAFLSHPRFHLDAIYWHTSITSEQAQSTFDQLCTFESANPFAKSYFLEVGGLVERLFQSLAIVLSHPAHRASQVAAEDLLESPSFAR